jgi:hypothetical protein
MQNKSKTRSSAQHSTHHASTGNRLLQENCVLLAPLCGPSCVWARQCQAYGPVLSTSVLETHLCRYGPVLSTDALSTKKGGKAASGVICATTAPHQAQQKVISRPVPQSRTQSRTQAKIALEQQHRGQERQMPLQSSPEQHEKVNGRCCCSRKKTGISRAKRA